MKDRIKCKANLTKGLYMKTYNHLFLIAILLFVIFQVNYFMLSCTDDTGGPTPTPTPTYPEYFTYGDETHVENGFCIAETEDKGYLIIGEISDLYGDDRGILNMKIDRNMEIVWKSEIVDCNYCWGITGKELDNYYFIIGLELNHSSGNTLILLKYDSAGGLLWSRNIELNTVIFPAVQPYKDGFVIAETFNNVETKTSEIYISKIDYDGNFTWKHSFAKDHYCGINFIQETSDEGLILCGNSGSGEFVIKRFC